MIYKEVKKTILFFLFLYYNHENREGGKEKIWR